jgi:hypothetical protein
MQAYGRIELWGSVALVGSKIMPLDKYLVKHLVTEPRRGVTDPYSSQEALFYRLMEACTSDLAAKFHFFNAARELSLENSRIWSPNPFLCCNAAGRQQS